MKRALLLTLLIAAALPASAEDRPVLVVYDFTSAFDDGAMGAWVAETVRGHALRSGRTIGNPKITVDEVLADRDFKPTVDTTPEKLAAFTHEAFGADLFIYGSVAKRGDDDYQVRFRVYRASADGAPEVVLDETHDCPGKRFIPLAVDEVLNASAGVKDWRSEWTALAVELAACADALDADAKNDALAAVDWRQHVIAWQDKLDARWLNVLARSNFDFANKALLDYVQEVRDRHREVQVELTGGDPAKARAEAPEVSALTRALARSITYWLDDDSAENRWKTGKNLVLNGSFEHGQGTPANWQPLKEHMSWVDDPDGKSGKVVRFDMPEDVAATTGMLLYSDPIRVEVGATYRLRWRFRTLAPAVKLFIKGYAAFEGEFEFAGQDREVWRSRKDPQFGERVVQDYNKGEWTNYGHDFVPFAGKTDARTGRFLRSPAQPKTIRLMLYAYWPKGVVTWDDIVVKKIKDAPIRPKTETPE